MFKNSVPTLPKAYCISKLVSSGDMTPYSWYKRTSVWLQTGASYFMEVKSPYTKLHHVTLNNFNSHRSYNLESHVTESVRRRPSHFTVHRPDIFTGSCFPLRTHYIIPRVCHTCRRNCGEELEALLCAANRQPGLEAAAVHSGIDYVGKWQTN
jgi:hypothetical protein